jgi:hypothetical protein
MALGQKNRPTGQMPSNCQRPQPTAFSAIFAVTLETCRSARPGPGTPELCDSAGGFPDGFACRDLRSPRTATGIAHRLNLGPLHWGRCSRQIQSIPTSSLLLADTGRN